VALLGWWPGKSLFVTSGLAAKTNISIARAGGEDSSHLVVTVSHFQRSSWHRRLQARRQTRSYIVIPARLASPLARKLLLTKRQVSHRAHVSCRPTSTAASRCLRGSRPRRIAGACGLRREVVMTVRLRKRHRSRAEVARTLTDVDILVNVQGDEPNYRARRRFGCGSSR